MSENINKLYTSMIESGLHVRRDMLNGLDILYMRFNTDYGPLDIIIRFHNEITICISFMNIAIADCTKESKPRLYKAVHEMNMQTCLFKFNLYEEGEKIRLNAQYDYLISPTDALWMKSVIIPLIISGNGFKDQREMFYKALYSKDAQFEINDVELENEIDGFLKRNQGLKINSSGSQAHTTESNSQVENEVNHSNFQCKKCGYTLNGKVRFCPKCGEKLVIHQ